MTRRALTDDHTYVEMLRNCRQWCDGPNGEWVDRFLAARPRKRRAMLTADLIANDTSGVSNRNRRPKTR